MNQKDDDVRHPPHYTSHPSGIEFREIARHMNFNLGNVLKYIWRAGLKVLPTDPDAQTARMRDLLKAAEYLNDEIAHSPAPHVPEAMQHFEMGDVVRLDELNHTVETANHPAGDERFVDAEIEFKGGLGVLQADGSAFSAVELEEGAQCLHFECSRQAQWFGAEGSEHYCERHLVEHLKRHYAEDRLPLAEDTAARIKRLETAVVNLSTVAILAGNGQFSGNLSEFIIEECERAGLGEEAAGGGGEDDAGGNG